MIKVNRIDSAVEKVSTVAISGHIRPDGDCIGSCLGMYHYLKENFPHLSCVDVYLEETQDCFNICDGIDQIHHSCEEEISYDLFIALDSSDRERLGDADKYFRTAKKTICFDHHISNKGYADENYIEPNMSSASELVFYAMDPEKISKTTAEMLYMGIAHDSGIFQYSSTTPQTMQTAAFLMSKGIDHNEIIDITFMQKSYVQNLLLAKGILESELMYDGKLILSGFRKVVLESYNASHADLNGIISQLRNTTGVEVAVLLDETEENVYKISMRSKSYVDVSRIATLFGGGGHVRAAGCTLTGNYEQVCDTITQEIGKQI